MNSTNQQQTHLDRKLALEQYKQQKKQQVHTTSKSPMPSTTSQAQTSLKNQVKPPQPPAGNMLQQIKSQQQQRAQLNQTNAQVTSKFASQNHPIATNKTPTPTSFKVPSSKALPGVLNGQVRGLLQAQPAACHQLETEVSLIYQLYRKNQELENAPPQVKNTHDPEKWKKKFYLVFTREKGVLELAVNPAQPLDHRNLSTKVASLNKLGEKLMKSSAKFWIIYIKLVGDKLNQEMKDHYKEHLKLHFYQSAADYQIIYNELGSQLNLVEPQQQQEQSSVVEDKENVLPTFGGMQLTTSEPLQEQEVDAADQQKQEQPLQEHQNPTGCQIKKMNETFSNRQAPTDTTTVADGLFLSQQTQEREQEALVIQPPSQSYLVRAPVQMSMVSMMSTPNFQEYKNMSTQEDEEQFNALRREYQQQREQEEEELMQDVDIAINLHQQMMEAEEGKQQQQEQSAEELEAERVLSSFNEGKPDVTINEVLPDARFIEEDVIEEEINNQMAVEEDEVEEPYQEQVGACDQTVILEKQPEEVQQIFTEDQMKELQDEPEGERDIQLDVQFEQESHEEVNEEKEDTFEQQDEDDQEHAGYPSINSSKDALVLMMDTSQVEQSSAKPEPAVEEEFVELIPPLPLPASFAHTDHLFDQEKPIVHTEEEEVKQPEQEEPLQNTNKKRKRSRSPSYTPTGTHMTLRSKCKMRRLNIDETDSNLLPQIGASYIRYEIIDKRGQQMLVPVRYSIRKSNHLQPAASLNTTTLMEHEHELERKILNNEIEFAYHPSSIEELFNMDKTTQEIQRLLKTRFAELEKADIEEVVSINQKGNFSLVKIRPECREKYGGQVEVAAALKRLSVSPMKREGQMRQMMEQLLKEKKMREVILTNASDEAIEYIKRN